MGFNEEEAEIAEKRNYDTMLFLQAVIPPVIAFFAYGQISHGVAVAVDLMGFRGTNVDGNAFANNLLRPTINGVVGEYKNPLQLTVPSGLTSIDSISLLPISTLNNYLSSCHGSLLGYSLCNNRQCPLESPAHAKIQHQQGSV